MATPAIAPAVQAAGTAGRVVLRLRGPGEETTSDLPVELSVEAGQTVSLTALVRNESEIVEHFRLSVDGLPDGWWSVEREVVRLLSFGSGEYETELAVAIHPPRTAHARAGRWEFEVVASAVAQTLEARAAASVDVQPFQALELAVRPPVAAGRRRARFYADVGNVGNTPVAVDVGASELEDRCRFVLPAASIGIVPGQTTAIPIGVRPRRPLIIGRKADRLLELRAWTADDEPGPVVSSVGDLPPASLDPVVAGAPRPAARDRGGAGVPALAGSRDGARRRGRAQRLRGPGAARAGGAHGVARLEERGAHRRRAGNRDRPDARCGHGGRPRDRGHAAARPRRPRDPRAGRARGSLRARPTSGSSRRTSRSGPSLRSSIRRERSRARSRCPAGCAGGARPSTSSSPARR